MHQHWEQPPSLFSFCHLHHTKQEEQNKQKLTSSIVLVWYTKQGRKNCNAFSRVGLKSCLMAIRSRRSWTVRSIHHAQTVQTTNRHKTVTSKKTSKVFRQTSHQTCPWFFIVMYTHGGGVTHHQLICQKRALVNVESQAQSIHVTNTRVASEPHFPLHL